MIEARPIAPLGPSSTPARPVAPQERIALVDALRGFALLGILLVNVAWFSQPAIALMTGEDLFTAPADRLAAWLIRVVAEGKFYSIFSFLFGFGLAIQMQRAAAGGATATGRFARRLAILLAFGAAHLVFIWVGDILSTYAIFGFALLLFRNCRPRTLLIWAAALSLFPTLTMTGCIGLASLAQQYEASPPATDSRPVTASIAAPASAPAATTSSSGGDPFTDPAARQAAINEEIRVYRNGSFAEQMRQRIASWSIMLIFLFFTGPTFLALFLLGLCAGKCGFFRDPDRHRVLIRRVLLAGLIIGIPANLAYARVHDLSMDQFVSIWTILSMPLATLGGPILSAAYVCGFILLWQNPAAQRWMSRLAPVGRTALTNYLLQSLICTTVFYSYGLALFGRVGPALGILITLLVFAAQVAFSNWLMSRVRYGPMEWLWRTLTYGRPPSPG